MIYLPILMKFIPKDKGKVRFNIYVYVYSHYLKVINLMDEKQEFLLF